ncbi:hypothetical protein [Candidatus Uabimicrobium sp. HlEnr_7]|uniref:hypothetical protein n=1 Tax=Candidatus Uabimicrobium helgolandensis TaxID=3095367 RepID=UPI003557900C
MKKIKQLQEKGVILPHPQTVSIAEEVKIENIEPGAVLYPGIKIAGEKTLIGSGSKLGAEHGGIYTNVRCGRNVTLGSGSYSNSVFLDHVEIRSGAEMRKGTLFMEHARAAHTVGCKMTIVSMYATLGSLINFCDVFVSSGTNAPYAFTEIGSGAIHYNFTPEGLKFGSLIGSGVLGEMGLSPRVFVGGQTQIVAPCRIGSGSLIPAGVAIRGFVPENTMAVSTNLKPGMKPYHPELLTNSRQKFLATTELMIHYVLLEKYFRKVRCAHAKKNDDNFLYRLYSCAADNINDNFLERKKWLFSKAENNSPIHFIAKLPESSDRHAKLQKKSWKNKALFHEKNIKEHQTIISTKDLLGSKVQQLANLDLSMPDLCFDNTSFEEWIYSLNENTKQQISNMWQQTIDEQQSLFSKIFSEEVEKNTEPYDDYLHILRDQKQLIVDFDHVDEELGIVNDCKRRSNEELTVTLGRGYGDIIRHLASFDYPFVVDWNLLHSFSAQTKELQNFVSKSLFRLHGTDGIRGNVHYSNNSFADSVARYIRCGDLTPQLCSLLAYSSILAFEKIYGKPAVVGVAKDTRDLYIDDSLRSDCLYEALKQGVAATERTVYDLGIMPIANAPYVLASSVFKEKQQTINLILYKSASHNPASQDGLKIFIEDEHGRFVKAMSKMENTITALIFYYAVNFRLPDKYNNVCLSSIAEHIFTSVVNSGANLPGTTDRDVAIVCDLSHGALSAPSYKDALSSAIKKCGIQKIEWVGDKPNGTNINNNSGDDRVGAGHFENVEEIKRNDIELGGKYNGFPALKKLFAYKEKPQTIAFAIFMDGDGDRGITAVYNPFTDIAYIFDGDKSLFLQIRSAVDKKSLTVGTTIAFTVDSSIPFMNAMRSCVEELHPTELVMGQNTTIDKVNLQITPVGDKYILEQQCFGGEKSGHIIRGNHINDSQQVYVGNGFLANIHTVFSLLDLIKANNSDSFQEIAHLYPVPKSISVYVYFVKKELWYYESSLWKKVVSCIQKHFSDYVLECTKFAQEPDTLFFCSGKDDTLQFSIVARPSGTENKMGVKFSGTLDNINSFAEVSEEIFFLLVNEMKNTDLSSTKMEHKIMKNLGDKKQDVSDVKSQLVPQGDPIMVSHFFTVVEALAKQKLVVYDGVSISPTARSSKYLGAI